MNTALEIIAKKLTARGATLAAAESCTGGTLAGTLTGVPGASAFFRGGAVTYAPETKPDALRVPEAMARGAAEKFRADFALSTTGVAGPTGGTDAAPVGTVFIGLRAPWGTRSVRFFSAAGTREGIRRAAVEAALEMLAEAL